MPFYTYCQNNSGGKFKRDKDLDLFVIIEAHSAAHADCLTQNIGIYFDGVHNGLDCPCCGDRWYSAEGDKGTDSPEVYGMHPSALLQFYEPFKVLVHHLDGHMEMFDHRNPDVDN